MLDGLEVKVKSHSSGRVFLELREPVSSENFGPKFCFSFGNFLLLERFVAKVNAAAKNPEVI